MDAAEVLYFIGIYNGFVLEVSLQAQQISPFIPEKMLVSNMFFVHFSPTSLLLGVLNSFLRCVRPLCHCWCLPWNAGHLSFQSLLVSALFPLSALLSPFLLVIVSVLSPFRFLFFRFLSPFLLVIVSVLPLFCFLLSPLLLVIVSVLSPFCPPVLSPFLTVSVLSPFCFLLCAFLSRMTHIYLRNNVTV